MDPVPFRTLAVESEEAGSFWVAGVPVTIRTDVRVLIASVPRLGNQGVKIASAEDAGHRSDC